MLKAFTIESQTDSSYFDEVLNEKPVGDSRYTISGIGFPSKMMESNGGFLRPWEVIEVLLLVLHQFPSL